jgi:hypothetical protein
LSKAKVANQQDLINENIEKLCHRLSQYMGSDISVDIGAAISALTRDVAVQLVLGRSYNSLDSEDFDVGMTNVFQASGSIWRVTKHLPWFGPGMRAIPVDVMMKIADKDTKNFFKYLKASSIGYVLPKGFVLI